MTATESSKISPRAEKVSSVWRDRKEAWVPTWTAEFLNYQKLRSRQMEGILVTPRDLNEPFTSPTPQYKKYGFKGYPEGRMEKPREPTFVVSPVPDKLYSDYTSKSHNRSQQFDLKKPRAFGNPEMMEYGSESMQPNSITPRPIKGSLNEKNTSSAQIRSFRENQRIQQEAINRMKQERQEQKMAKLEENMREQEKTKNYNPFGGPGGGAPNSTRHHKAKFREEDLSPPEETDYEKQFKAEYGNFNDYFGKPGGGAVMRTESGKPKASYKTDTLIRHNNHGVLQTEHNHKIQDLSERQRYMRDLERQMEENSVKRGAARSTDLIQDQEMDRYDPFGRPGAGAPMKSQSGTTQLKRQQTLTNDSNELRLVERIHGNKLSPVKSDESYDYNDKFGQGVGQPQYTRHGNVRRFPQAHPAKGMYTENQQQLPGEEMGTSLDLEKGMGGAGAPIKTGSGRVVTRRPETLKTTDKGDNVIKERSSPKGNPRYRFADDEELQVYNPWGKGGAGAPIKDHHGNVQTTVYGNLKQPATLLRGSQEGYPKVVDPDSLAEIQKESELAQNQRKQRDYEMKYGAGEMATVMSKGKVGNPKRDPYTGRLLNQHLPSTDITKTHGIVVEPLQGPSKQQYHTELEKQAEYRARGMKLEKMKERQEANFHGDVYDSQWGRFGGGAPKGDNRRANLDQILDLPTRKSENYYVKAYGGISPPKFVKSVNNSTSRNHYEVEPSPRRPLAEPYNLSKPFATVPADQL